MLNALGAECLPGPSSVFLYVDLEFQRARPAGSDITAEAEVLEDARRSESGRVAL
jgi:hypothetical protein